MSSHDPFSPATAVAPPTADVEPKGQVAEADLTVLQPDETNASNVVPATPSPAPELPQTGAPEQTPNDAPTSTTNDQAPAQGQQGVKSGTSKEVLDWVNEAEGDERSARAQAALDVERTSSEPRKGLSHELEGLLGGRTNSES